MQYWKAKSRTALLLKEFMLETKKTHEYKDPLIISVVSEPFMWPKMVHTQICTILCIHRDEKMKWNQLEGKV